MKSTLISKEKNIAKFKMEFTAEEFEAAVVSAYQANKGKFEIDGFRKGKAPRSIIEKHYGEGIFYEDAIDNLLQTSYGAALSELNLNVIDQPGVELGDIEKGKGFDVTITVECYPELDVKGYKGVKIEKIEKKIAAAAVNAEIEAVRQRNARLVVVDDRAAKAGDTVLIDYAGFADGEQFEGGTAERYPLKLGSNTFIPGFEDQLVGVKTGEEKEVKVTFPKEYHSDKLAGKEAVFKCKVHEIKEEQLPELNDDFVKDISEFDTLAEYKKYMKKNLEQQAKKDCEMEMKDAVLKAVYAANEVDAPNVLVEDEIQTRLNEIETNLGYQGMSLEKYFEFAQTDLETLKKELRPDCEKAVKTRIIVSAVADAEKIEVTPEEADNYIEEMAKQYNMEVEKVKELLGPDNLVMMLRDLKMQKAVDFMYDNAVIEVPEKKTAEKKEKKEEK